MQYPNESRDEAAAQAEAHERSILLRNTVLEDKTVLDYRDFLNQSLLDRSRSVNDHNGSFVNETGVNELKDEDLDDLGHHIHSDLESDADEDPYFEYNQCHKSTKLDIKELAKTNLQDISLRRFFFKHSTEG